MKTQAQIPRMLAQPSRWWRLTLILAALLIASIVAREGAATYQRHLLQKAGWEVQDLRLVPGINNDDPYLTLRIWSAALAPNDTLWMATDYSLLSFDGTEWAVFSEFAEDVAIDGELNIWFAGLRGLHLLEDGKARWIADTNVGNVLLTGPQGRVWLVGSNSKGQSILLVWPDGSWKSVAEPVEGRQSSFVTCDPRGYIWTDDRRSGLWYVYNGHTWKSQAGPFGRPGLQIDAITFESDGDPWVATPSSLAYQRGGTWQRLERDIPGFTPGMGITSMTFDSLGTLWIAYGEHSWRESWVGLASHADSHWTVYEIEDVKVPLLDPSVWPVGELLIDSANRPWFAMGHYLVRLHVDSPSFSADPIPGDLKLVRIAANAAGWSLGLLLCLAGVLAIWSTLVDKQAAEPKPRWRLGIGAVQVLFPGVLLALLFLGSLVLFTEGVPPLAADDLGAIGAVAGMALGAGALCGAILFVGALGRHNRSRALRILGWLATILGAVSLLALVLLTLYLTASIANPW